MGNGTLNTQSGLATLSWAASDAASYDIYGGTSADPPLLVSDRTASNPSPGLLNAGTTYFWRVVAKNNEGSTSGPTWRFTTQPGAVPDLIVESLTVSPTSALPGAGVTVTFTVRNQGAGAAAPSLARIRLAAGTTITVNDPLLDSVSVPSLAARAAASFTRTVTIPAGTAAGSRFMGATANADAALAESDGNNNQRTTPFTVTAPPPAAPTITGISPNPVPGSNSRQWLTLTGTGFVAGSTVTLYTGGQSCPIPADRTSYLGPNQIQVFVNVTTQPAAWTAQVINPGNVASTLFPFTVR